MRKLVVIDLTNADVIKFEEYEKQVIPLLSKYGARLEVGLRSSDGLTETHVLHFPDAASFDSFLSDSVRASLSDDWQNIGAATSITDVHEVEYL